MPEESAHGPPGEANGSDRVSFSDLARAHYRWDQREDAEARSVFAETLKTFEESQGEIVDAYWCRMDASAVALTKKPAVDRGRGRLEGPAADEYRLFRVSDWVTAGTGEIPDLLHDCDVLAIKAASGLTGIPQAVVMQWLHSVESHVLGFIERHRDDPPTKEETRAFAAREHHELARIEEYYQRAGEKAAKLQYVHGMVLIGVPVLIAIGVVLSPLLALFGSTRLDDEGMQTFYAAFAAGGIGAVVSVLMRMSSGKFTIDHELGRSGVRYLGMYRPLIGAVSGIVIYFLVQTPLLAIDEDTRTFEFYAVIAFLAGFSERWTRVTLTGAMRTVDDDEPSEQSASSSR